jgi:hypothetical protein
MCVALPSGLSEGMIVLKGFFWELIKSEPGLIYDGKVGSE